MIEKIRVVLTIVGLLFTLLSGASLLGFIKTNSLFEEAAYARGFWRNFAVTAICGALVYILGGK